MSYVPSGKRTMGRVDSLEIGCIYFIIITFDMKQILMFVEGGVFNHNKGGRDINIKSCKVLLDDLQISKE